MISTSIVIATYNGEMFIEQQLYSLIKQTKCADEVIISDDNSSDSTLKIVRAFIKKYDLKNWMVIENRSNLGFILNFRRALAKAQGEAIFLCDQDDVWQEDKIERMISRLEKDENIMGLATSFSLIDDKGNAIDSPTKLFKSNNGLIQGVIKAGGCKEYSLGNIIASNLSPGCTTVFRKRIIEQYLMETKVEVVPHDWALCVFSQSIGKLVFWNQSFTQYRIHNRNVIGMATPSKTIISRRNLISKYCSILIEFSMYTGLKRHEEYFNYVYRLNQHRIESIKKRSILNWLMGLKILLHSSIIHHYSTYIADLIVILRGN